ncbi:MAG: OmpH family outer membrane protein [Rhizobacter sp.]|nr:OmpH family outer membrane protein [Chlorobiales bacterium]
MQILRSAQNDIKEKIFVMMRIYLSAAVRFVSLCSLMLFSWMLCGAEVFAQQKIGYVDSQAIIDQLPDAQDAKRKLETLSREWQEEVRKRREKIGQLFKDYQAKEILYTDELKQQKRKEIVDAEQDVSTYQNTKFGASGDYFKQQTDLMRPIQDRIFRAMSDVAKANGYDFVFDKSGEILLLYAKEDFDLTALVLEKVSGRLRTATGAEAQSGTTSPGTTQPNPSQPNPVQSPSPVPQTPPTGGGDGK